MESQRVQSPRQMSSGPGSGPGDDGQAEAGQRLAAERDGAAQIFAEAYAIIGKLRATGAQRFLDQAPQSGGQ